MADRIEKRIELKAPVSRVWRALTDYREFGEWFRVKLEGPFVEGQMSRGTITWPGYEHVVWEAKVQRMAPETLFSLSWGPIKSMDKRDLFTRPERSNYPGGVQAGADEGGHVAHAYRVWFRQYCARHAGGVLPQKRWWLDATDGKH